MQTLLTGWNFMRWLRLGFGVMIGIQAIQGNDTISGVISVFFLYQAVTNTGCCGSNGCAVPMSKKEEELEKETQYEEIKTPLNLK